MKDIKIGTIKPVGEPRARQEPPRKERSAESAFDREFRSALDKTNQVQTRSTEPAPGKMDSEAVIQQAQAENEKFKTAMEAKMALENLYKSINTNKS